MGFDSLASVYKKGVYFFIVLLLLKKKYFLFFLQLKGIANLHSFLINRSDEQTDIQTTKGYNYKGSLYRLRYRNSKNYFDCNNLLELAFVAILVR